MQTRKKQGVIVLAAQKDLLATHGSRMINQPNSLTGARTQPEHTPATFLIRGMNLPAPLEGLLFQGASAFFVPPISKGKDNP